MLCVVNFLISIVCLGAQIRLTACLIFNNLEINCLNSIYSENMISRLKRAYLEHCLVVLAP